MERSLTTLKFENDINHLVPKKGRILKKIESYLKRYWPLYVMLLPTIVYLCIFSYVPMAGLSLAFKDYNFRLGIWDSPWATDEAGNLDLFKHFRILFDNPEWWNSFGIKMKI